ncbi:sensor histidine kinase [Pseudoduganella sp. HUAS MS19]
MLYEFISSNRDSLLERCKKFREARTQVSSDERTDEAISTFLDQLIESLKIEQSSLGERASEGVSGSTIGVPTHYDIGTAATRHGKSMENLGFSVNDVVHSYGDMCHAIVELAIEQSMSFEVPEYRLLNRCLDNAVASAVTEFSYHHDMGQANSQSSDESQRLGAVANELRNQLGTATLAVAAIKTRELTLGGTTGAILERSLQSLGRLVEDMLQYAGNKDASRDLLDLFSLRQFMELLQQTIEPAAASLSLKLTLSAVDSSLAVKGGRDYLQAALAGLLQAAFQFSHVGEQIQMHAYASGKRILIDILCPSCPDNSLAQHPALAVARQLVAGIKGKLELRDGEAAPFTLSISLPRYSLPS